MEKIEKSFIGFVLSLKNIFWTLIVNFVVGIFYYKLYQDGIDSFYLSPGAVIVIAIFATIVYFAFWFLSYKAFKDKKNDIN